MEKFMSLVIITSLFAAIISNSPVESIKGKPCDVGHKILQDGEIGAAPLGDCFDVRCDDGVLQPLIGCGLIHVAKGCSPLPEDVTKLYPDCCGKPLCPKSD